MEKEEIIECELSNEIMNVNISNERVCKEQGIPWSQMNHNETLEIVKIGNCVLPIKFEKELLDLKKIQLKAIKKINLTSVSESQLSGRVID
jgi:hypothetical protein